MIRVKYKEFRKGERMETGKEGISMILQIVPFGVIDPEMIGILKQGIEGIFPVETCPGAGFGEPAYAYDPQRNQYSAEAILADLAEKGLEQSGHVLGLIDCDLYIPDLTFVFGVALGKTALISLTRLRQEFYGLKADEDLLGRRLLTEAVHEIGHLYGMKHCFDPGCVMYFSRTLGDTDKKGFDFCDRCHDMISRISKPFVEIDEDDPRLKPSLNIML